MHFWIEKPTSQYYGSSGQHHLNMSFPKPHFGQHRHRCSNNFDVSRLQMVTPVHRFQTINSSAGPSNSFFNRPIRQISQHCSSDNRNLSRSFNEHRDNDGTTNTTNNQNIPSLSTNTTNRGHHHSSEISDAELAGYRLHCSIWIIFVLATGFVAAARFYFDHQQDAGLEVLVFCGLLATLLMSGCFYSIACHRSYSNQEREAEVGSVATVTVSDMISNESDRQIILPAKQNPPPPYHIAILIPPLISPEESPPPSYDKIEQ